MSDFNMRDILLDKASRADMAVTCRDCDLLPKNPDWGTVISFVVKPVQIMHNGLRVVAGGSYGDWRTGIIERLGGHHEGVVLANAALRGLAESRCERVPTLLKPTEPRFCSTHNGSSGLLRSA
ncbi:MAG: hypothetical protein JWP25_8309 [Bradyrhizobium sp.]|nr:hypothetical protein [Bradyrhizobium sp.]